MFLTDPALMPPAEHSLGAAGMRAPEIRAYLQKYEDIIGPIDHTQSKKVLVTMMDGFVTAGKIPHPYQPPVDAAMEQAKQLAETQTELEDLRKQVAALMRGEMTAEPAELPAEEAELIEDVPENPTYDDLKWQELKREASKAGINTYKKSRAEVEAELSALG